MGAWFLDGWDALRTVLPPSQFSRGQAEPEHLGDHSPLVLGAATASARSTRAVPE